MQGFPTKPYTTGPFESDLCSPEVVWVGAGTMFPHPEKGRVRQAGLRSIQIISVQGQVYIQLHPRALDLQLYAFHSINTTLYKHSRIDLDPRVQYTEFRSRKREKT